MDAAGLRQPQRGIGIGPIVIEGAVDEWVCD
jgi:hypothetical protein